MGDESAAPRSLPDAVVAADIAASAGEEETAAPLPISEEEAAPRWPIPDREEIREVIAEFSGARRRTFARALQRSGRYVPMIRSALRDEGLPEELAYLPLVESHYFPRARSRAGAVGLWQFIDTTARASGLRVDWWVDQRLDVIASTRAAVRHLAELHERFQDWELALAAYNAGPGGVARALRRSGTRDFWGLSKSGHLRTETRRYVPKFYASVAIAADPERYGFGEVQRDPPLSWSTVWVDEPLDLHSFSRVAGIPVTALQGLNPALRRNCTPPGNGRFPVYVPAGVSVERVEEELVRLEPRERLDFVRYRVRRGDTLWHIARRYGTRTEAISQLNGVRDARLLRPGVELVVPVPRKAPSDEGRFKPAGSLADRQAGRIEYTVQGGDTVARIARLYGVSVADILRWNGLDEQGLIRPDDRLVVHRSEGTDGQVAGTRVHVVQSGETLWGISRRYGVSLRRLLRTNRLSPDSVLRPGDRLLVNVGDPS